MKKIIIILILLLFVSITNAQDFFVQIGALNFSTTVNLTNSFDAENDTVIMPNSFPTLSFTHQIKGKQLQIIFNGKTKPSG